MTLWSKQPFSTLYIIFLVAKLVGLLPLTLLRYSPKWARPIPGCLKIYVVNFVARELFRSYTKTRSHLVASVERDQKRAKERFALAQPADASLYSGVLTPRETARPAAVGGIWYSSPIQSVTGSDIPNLKNEKVVLHCPGGAFVLAFGTDESGQAASGVFSKHLISRTFLAQYRVSRDPQSRFPAAIQDMVTFYHYVLSLGVQPQNILVSGDSAAGNLVLGLLRYLEDESQHASRLPLPGGAMVWSPWVHVTPQAGRDYEECRNSKNDLLVGSLLQWGADSYLPEGKLTSDELGYISPLHHPFKTSVPLFIHAGACEAFFDHIKDFVQEMGEMEGNRIRFNVTELSPHNLLLAHKGLGMEREMEVAAKDAYDFFAQSE